MIDADSDDVFTYGNLKKAPYQIVRKRLQYSTAPV